VTWGGLTQGFILGALVVAIVFVLSVLLAMLDMADAPMTPGCTNTTAPNMVECRAAGG
jgi:hypothetical protein